MKRLLLTVSAAAISLGIWAQKTEFANTIKVEPLEGHENLKEKAVHVIPTKNQLAALDS